jgi:hypothetical protein
MPLNRNWHSVSFGNGVFVAVAGRETSEQVVATSTDGITWTERSLPKSDHWDSVAFGGGTFVVLSGTRFSKVGQFGDSVLVSSDGINWSQQKMPKIDGWDSVVYGNGKFVAQASVGVIGDNYNNVAVSSDGGLTWKMEIVLGATWTGNQVYFSNGMFSMFGTSSQQYKYYFSSDGAKWSELQSYAPSWLDVAASFTFGASKSVAVGPSGKIAYSIDSIYYVNANAPAGGPHWQSVIYGAGNFVTVGKITDTYPSALFNAAISSDGINWSKMTIGQNDWRGIAFGNGRFVAISSTQSAVWVPNP